jgi:DNA-binding transcriptional LysR family regulator
VGRATCALDQLGVALFDRSGAHITLTLAGQALLPYAEKLKSLSDEALSAVSSAGGKPGGQLALGASQTIAHYLLPNLIAGFLHENPRVSVTSRSGNTDAVLDALAEQKIQLALIEGPALRKDIHVDPFMEDYIVLVVPAHHPWANQEIDADKLRSAPLLMRELNCWRHYFATAASVALSSRETKSKKPMPSIIPKQRHCSQSIDAWVCAPRRSVLLISLFLPISNDFSQLRILKR